MQRFLPSARSPRLNAHSHEVKTMFGLDPKAKWPVNGLPVRELHGIKVWVESIASTKFNNRFQRVRAECPVCCEIMGAGRLHQHRCELTAVNVQHLLNKGYSDTWSGLLHAMGHADSTHAGLRPRMQAILDQLVADKVAAFSTAPACDNTYRSIIGNNLKPAAYEFALDQGFVEAVYSPMLAVWQAIAEEGIEADNSEAIEMVLDADRLTTFGYPEADKLVDAAIKAHDYLKVAAFLEKHVQLV